MIFSAIHRRDVLKGLVTGAGALAGAGPTLAQRVRVRRNIATAPAPHQRKCSGLRTGRSSSGGCLREIGLYGDPGARGAAARAMVLD